MKQLLVMLGLALTALSAHANLLVNGSFENPDVPTGTWQVVGALTGWNTATAGVEIRDHVAGTAQNGTQFVELDTHFGKATNSYLYQALNTVANQIYSVSFWYSARPGTKPDTNGIIAQWNDTVLGGSEITGNGVGQHDHVWQLFTFTVQGSGADTLKFIATGNDDTYGGSLDHVSVNPVPVPAAMPLVATALGIFGMMRRRTTVKQMHY